MTMTPGQPYFRLLTALSSSRSASFFLGLLIGLKELVRFHTTLGMLAQKVQGTERIERSKQYQSTMTFQLTALKKKAMKIEKPKQLVFGYINESDSSDGAEMNEEEKY